MFVRPGKVAVTAAVVCDCATRLIQALPKPDRHNAQSLARLHAHQESLPADRLSINNERNRLTEPWIPDEIFVTLADARTWGRFWRIKIRL